MFKITIALAAASALMTGSALAADMNGSKHHGSHRHHAHNNHGHHNGAHHFKIVYDTAAYTLPHAHAEKVHYGGKPGLGYWRRGPAHGYGFGFSSYKGDPFGSDDYSDGQGCFYLHHKNYCVKNRIFTGFRAQ